MTSLTLTTHTKQWFGAPINELDPQTLAIIRIVDKGDSPSTATPTSVDWGDEVTGPCIDLDDSELLHYAYIHPR